MSSTSSHRTCPTCARALESFSHEGVDLDRCPQGCGVWLDRGELQAVVASQQEDRPEGEEHDALEQAARDSGAAVVEESRRESRACPVCSGPLRVVEFGGSGIPVDECQAHGTWLDAGELHRIEAYSEGLRAQARGGAAVDRARAANSGGVVGIDVPADLLATISRSIAPPPPVG